RVRRGTHPRHRERSPDRLSERPGSGRPAGRPDLRQRQPLRLRRQSPDKARFYRSREPPGGHCRLGPPGPATRAGLTGMTLAVLGALAVGASLGLLGSGGSILTVPILVYVL